MAPSLFCNVKKLKELWEEDKFGWKRGRGFGLGAYLTWGKCYLLVVLRLLQTNWKEVVYFRNRSREQWMGPINHSSILVPTMHTEFNTSSSHPEKMWDWSSWCRINKVSACVYYPHFFFRNIKFSKYYTKNVDY